jgi:hypothetical protein
MGEADHLLQTGSMNGYQWLVSTDRQLDVILSRCSSREVRCDYVLRQWADKADGRAKISRLGFTRRNCIQPRNPARQHGAAGVFFGVYVFGAPTTWGYLPPQHEHLWA